MAILIQSKVAAATLVEVVIALVITTLVFGIAMMIYVNVLNSSTSNGQLQQALLLKAISEETIQEGRFIDERIVRDGFEVVKSVEKVRGSDKLLHLHFEIVSPQSMKPVTRDQLISIQYEED